MKLQVELLYEEQDVALAPIPPILAVDMPDVDSYIPVAVELVYNPDEPEADVNYELIFLTALL